MWSSVIAVVYHTCDVVHAMSTRPPLEGSAWPCPCYPLSPLEEAVWLSLYRVETCKVLYYSYYRLRQIQCINPDSTIASAQYRSSQPPAIATSYCSLWHTLIIDHLILFSSSPVSSEHSVTRSCSSDTIDSDYF